MQSTPPAAVLPLSGDDDAQQRRAEVMRYASLFGIVYFAQGICQVVLLLDQPLKFYLKQVHGYTADKLAAFVYVVSIPWMIKPLYGLVSDFVPIGGYRRRSYLLLTNLLAAGAFCWTYGVRSPGELTVALLLTGVGVACSDVVTDALMVEAGQRTGRVKLFQGVQWTCISLASIAAALAGGYLCEILPATRALPVAAAIGAAAAAAVAVIAWLLVREEKSRLDLSQLKLTARGMASAFTSAHLWLVLLYLALTQFKPGMVTPLYVHMTGPLGMSQAFYGEYKAFAAGGFALGAVLFTLVIAPRLSTRTGIVLGLLVLAAALFAFAGLLRPHAPTIRALGVAYGTGYMMANLALLSLAAETCPRRAEAFTFAALTSVMNFAMQGGDWVGGRLYETTFQRTFWPLAVTCAAVTLLAAALVPLLPRGGTGDADSANSARA